LDEFLFCQPDDGEAGGPSWVMDMRQDAMKRYKMTGLYLRNPQGFQAKQAVQVLADGNILQVKGIYIDAIESVEFIDEDDFEYFAREMYADMSRKARAAQDQPIPNDHHLYDLDEIKQVGSIDNTFAGGADSNCVLIDSIVANRSLFTTPPVCTVLAIQKSKLVTILSSSTVCEFLLYYDPCLVIIKLLGLREFLDSQNLSFWMHFARAAISTRLRRISNLDEVFGRE
jgi:hypothetical protein